ncbi:hypothetical protein [Streptomyces carminius]|uniref:hypothetical protein n=1 Tax=Streptomyces carminius TaxID=2665496 RepID=UPI0011B4E552|nr:hypothetical protein [Streptomyces carminius]
MREINFPDEVSTMLYVLLGEKPLQARENLAYDSRELYLAYGQRLRALREAVRSSIERAGTDLPPAVADRYVKGLSLLVDDNGVDHLQRMIDSMDDLARGQVDRSMGIQASKWEIIAEITMLLIELALYAALAYFTGGTSLTQMALARARSRLAVLIIIDRLIRLSQLGPTLGGALEEGLQTLAVRLAQISLNPSGRRPDGVDWGDVGKAMAFGALAAGFESVLRGGADRVRNWTRNISDSLGIPGLGKVPDFEKPPGLGKSTGDGGGKFPHTRNALDHGFGIPEVFVVSALSETAAEVLVNWAFDGKLEWSWDTFAGAGAAGVTTTAAMSLASDAGLGLRELSLGTDRFDGVGDPPPSYGAAVDGTSGTREGEGEGASDVSPGTLAGGTAYSARPAPPGPPPYPAPSRGGAGPRPPAAAAPVTNPSPSYGPGTVHGGGDRYVPAPGQSPEGTAPLTTPPATVSGAAPYPSPATNVPSSSAADHPGTRSPGGLPGTSTGADTGTVPLPGSAAPGTAPGSPAGPGPLSSPPAAEAGDTLPRDAGPGHDAAPDSAPESAAPRPSGPVGSPDPAWEAARAAAPSVTRSHTWVDPVSAPPDPERPGRTTQYAVHSKFDARRFEHGGEWVTDLTVQVGSRDPAGLPEPVWDKLRAGVEELLNAPGYRLPNGDRLHISVEQVAHDPHPHGLNVGVVGPDQQMTRVQWHADAEAVDYVHELLHQLGLRDEAGHWTAPQRPDITGTLLGDYTRPAPDGLPQNGLRDRHLSLLAALIGDLGTGAGTGGTAPSGTAPARPAAAATAGGPFGAEPHAPRGSRPATPASEPNAPAPSSTTSRPQTSSAASAPASAPPPGPASAPPVVTTSSAAPVPPPAPPPTPASTTSAEPAPAPPSATPDEPTAEPTDPDPQPAVEAPAPLAGRAFPPPAGKEWLTTALDRDRPPVLVPDAPEPDGGGSSTVFPDGSVVPAHIDDLRSLLGEVPPGVAAEALVSFGHGDIALRGPELMLAEITRLLRDNPAIAPAAPASPAPKGIGPGSAGVRALLRAYRSLSGRPGPPEGDPGAPPVSPESTDLIADISHALRHEPRSLLGEGRSFPYTDLRGAPAVLHITAVHHRDRWQRFDDGYGSGVKVDTMQRSVVTGGQSKNTQSSAPLGLAVPIGPMSTAAFGGYGRVAPRAAFVRKAGYGQTDQGTGQTETRALDGSHVHLTDVHLRITVTGVGGRTMPPDAGERAAATVFGFTVRDGLSARLPDSATRPPAPLAARIPRSMALGGASTYRLVRPEDFGPVSHILTRAAAEADVKPGSDAYRELSAFFNTGSFHRHARAAANGRIITPPLFADDGTPLGAFVVDIVPTRAALVSSTADAETRDISVSTVRNERSLAHTTVLGLELAAGPAFNFFDSGPLDVRFQFGGAARYLVSWTRARGLGGSGATRTAGQVKGGNTALYLVKKDVFVSRTGTGGRPWRFQTWGLDRMTHTEARRLAGWDDGTAFASANGAPEPFAPAYLTADRPRTLGMHRVEEFTHPDGRLRHGDVPGTAPGTTLLDAFADDVIRTVAQVYPRLVAPLAELSPPPGRRGQLAAFFRGERSLPSRPGLPQWRDRAEYEAAVFNTRQILALVSDTHLRAALEALTTTGILIPLYETGRLGQAHRYVRIRGELTRRRFRGVQDDFRHRFSSVGAERLDAQAGAKRVGEAALEGALSLRDPAKDDIGAPHNSGTLSLGVREGWQSDTELSFGLTATNEPMAVSGDRAHLYSYELSLTAEHGGYWRFRGLVRGIATLGLLGTGPFVFSRPGSPLIGTGSDGRPVGGGPRTGRVLISVPAVHAPVTDPHAEGARNPYAPAAEPPSTALVRPERALALAMGDLSDADGPDALADPDDPAGLVEGTGPAAPEGAVPLTGTGRRLFRELRRHPFVTVGVLAAPELLASVDDLLRSAPGGSWQLTEEGAPVRSAILRAFQPQLLTSNFDQSSGPLGWSAAGLLAKGPYLSVWATFRQLTTVSGIQALTPSVPMDSEMIIGGAGQTAGKVSRSRTVFTGGQLAYYRAHAAGPGLLGTYGLVASPYSAAEAGSLSVARIAVADMNRKSFGHQVLVAGTAEHRLVLATSRLGPGAVGRTLVPRQLAGAAGRLTAVPGGWQAHVPEKSAHELGLVEDGLGEVPRYARHSWSPQPWLRGNEFGTYPVDSLDATRALAAFDRQVATLGLAEEERERVRTLVTSRVARALGREMTGTGSSVPVRSSGWGWHGLRVGGRKARVRVRLVPGRTTLHMLDHGVEMEENRRAVETVTRSREATRGAELGHVVGEGVHTGAQDARGPVAAGPALNETGGSRRSAGSAHSVTTLTVFRAASTEPYAVTDTPYELEIVLELDNSPGSEETPPRNTDRSLTARAGRAVREFTGNRAVSVREPAGVLRENIPLSLMVPDPEPGTDGRRLPPPELPALPAPRELTVGERRPRPRHADGLEGPFAFPEHGFDVRRIAGRDNVRAAVHYAVALSYDAGFSLDRDDAPRRAGDTGLTRAGTGSAQLLEDGTTDAMLTAFFHRAVTDDGYRLIDLTEKNLIGTDSAAVRLTAAPDFGRAVLLTVADGEKMEVLRRTGEGTGAARSEENTHDVSPGAVLAVASPTTGLNQYMFTAPGPSEGAGAGTPAGDDHLASVNVKPKTGRVFVFAVPTTWLSDADVRRDVRDTRLLRKASGVFGHVRPGPKTVRSDSHVLVRVREDIARRLGLITDARFPERVGQAWDAVGKASKGFVTADEAYWEKRRPGAARYAELRAARDALDTARERARQARSAHRRAAQAMDPANSALERAAQAVREADRRLAEATGRHGAALAAWESLRDELTVLRERAEAAAAEYHRVRAAADQLTWWHQRAAVEGGRARLIARGFPEPPPVTYLAPPKPPAAPVPPAPAPAMYTRTTEDGRAVLASPGSEPVTYVLHDVPRDGDAFFHSLAEGLRRAAPERLAGAGVDLSDLRSAPARLRRVLADRLTGTAADARGGQGGLAELLDAVAPDGTDTFTAEEITGAGLTGEGTGPLAPGTPQRREFDALDGLLPHSTRLDRRARAALAAAQLLRPGDHGTRSTWDNSAADLLPLLAAHTFGVDITVVGSDGRFQDFGPAVRPEEGDRGAPPVPRPRLVLSLHDDHYQLAVPAGGDTDGDADGTSTPAPPPPSATTGGEPPPTASVGTPAERRQEQEQDPSPAREQDPNREPEPHQTPPTAKQPPSPPAPPPPSAATSGEPPPTASVGTPAKREQGQGQGQGQGQAQNPGPAQEQEPNREPGPHQTPPTATPPPPAEQPADRPTTGALGPLLAGALADRLGSLRAAMPGGDGNETVSTAELDAVGAVLPPGQVAQAALLGDRLPLGEVELAPLQRLRLILLRRYGEASVPEDTGAAADVLASALGIDLVLSGPDGRYGRFGPGAGPGAGGPVVRLHFDGARFVPV